MVPAVPIGITNIERTAFTPLRRQEWISNEAIHNTIITLDKFEVFPVFFPQKIVLFFKKNHFCKIARVRCVDAELFGYKTKNPKIVCVRSEEQLKLQERKVKSRKKNQFCGESIFRGTRKVISKDVMSYSMCVVRFIWPFGCLLVPALSIMFHSVSFARKNHF